MTDEADPVVATEEKVQAEAENHLRFYANARFVEDGEPAKESHWVVEVTEEARHPEEQRYIRWYSVYRDLENIKFDDFEPSFNEIINIKASHRVLHSQPGHAWKTIDKFTVMKFDRDKEEVRIRLLDKMP
jgi:hypothetical protein